MPDVRRPTVADVATFAGVSRQTVSNALNRPSVVRPETLARVRDAIQTLGYRPLAAARQLRSGRSRTIAFGLPVVPASVSGITDRFLHALTAAAQHREHHVLLFSAGSDEEDIETYEELLDGGAVDCFVLADTHHDDARTAWLGERGARFATFGRPWGDVDERRHDWVDVDGAAGTHAATAHLAALGHRRIGFIGWPPGSGVGDDRRSGWVAALVALGLEAHLDAGVPNFPEEGRTAAERLMAGGATALVCASDSLALGALAAAQGRRVAVVGFDDTQVAAAIGLSSIAQPLEEAAAWVVERVLAPSPSGPLHTLLEPVLVQRSSSVPGDPASQRRPS